MAEHPNVTLVRRAYEAFAKGDFRTILDIMPDDLRWHVPGANLISGLRTRKRDVADYFETMAETASKLELEVHDVVGNDEHVVGILRHKHSRWQTQLDIRSTQVWHVRDGKLVEMWEQLDDIRPWDDFWR